MKRQEKNLVFKKVSGFAQGILKDREKSAGDETGKVGPSYTEEHLVCPSEELIHIPFPWDRKKVGTHRRPFLIRQDT